jgi:hypothetical protein
MQPLMEMVGKQFSPFMEMVCNRLWKWLATSLSYPRQYATDLGNRLWKWYVTACLVTYLVMQPLMEMVGKQFSPFMELRWGSCQESSSPRLWKWYVTVYGNGCNQQHTRQLLARYYRLAC